jgi:hypothetical protein
VLLPPAWPADPSLEPLLSTDTGTFTEPGALTETTEPPADWLPAEAELLPEALPLLDPLLATATGTLTEPGVLTEISDPPVDWLEPPWLPELPWPLPDWPFVPPDTLPLPDPLLATETGTLTELGRAAEISDPPAVWLPVLLAVELLPEVPPWLEPVLSADTGRLIAGSVAEISDPPADGLVPP